MPPDMDLRWRWRLVPAVISAALTGIELAWALARHAPLDTALERLYAGLFIGTACGLVTLMLVLLAPDIRQLAGRVVACLLLSSAISLLVLSK